MDPTLFNDASYIWNAYIPIPIEITRYIICLVNLESVSSVSRACKLFDQIVRVNSITKFVIIYDSDKRILAKSMQTSFKILQPAFQPSRHKLQTLSNSTQTHSK